MDAAHELDRVSHWKNCSASRWAIFYCSRLYEDIRRPLGLRLEHHTWSNYCPRRALWPRDGVPGKQIQWNDKPANNPIEALPISGLGDKPSLRPRKSQ